MSPSLAGGRSALVAAAIAAVAAPALAYLMVQLPLFTPHVLSLYAVCVAALVAFAAPAGTWLGPRVVAASRSRAYALGVVFAWVALAWTIVAGGFFEWVRSPFDDTVTRYLVLPLYWVGIFGCVPAAILGCLFVRLARR